MYTPNSQPPIATVIEYDDDVVIVKCPYCPKNHTHGNNGPGLTHRVSDCAIGIESGSGYYFEIPK